MSYTLMVLVHWKDYRANRWNQGKLIIARGLTVEFVIDDRMPIPCRQTANQWVETGVWVVSPVCERYS